MNWNWHEIEYAHPHLLWLLAVPVILLFWKGRHGRPPALRLPTTMDATVTGRLPHSAIRGFRLLPMLLAMAMGIVALARPRIGKGTMEIEASGIDIILTLDVSGSMQAMDFTLNNQRAMRLEVVKDVVANFLKERPGDKIGMVAFAGRPYLVGPLTMNHAWLNTRLADVKIGMVEDGTAIGSAIASAVDRLSRSEAKSRIAILLTDGVQTAGGVNPETSAEAAKKLGIKIYTIGAGTNGEAPMPQRDVFGTVRLIPTKVEIDEAMLTKVAELTGGKYFRATDTRTLEDIYATINELEKTERKVKHFKSYEELYLWLLIPAISILLVEWLLIHTIWRRLP